MPVSATRNVTISGAPLSPAARVTERVMVPFSVNLAALERRLRSIWRTLVRSACIAPDRSAAWRSEEHTSELQSRRDLVCRLLLEKKNKKLRKVLLTRPLKLI